MNDNKFWVMFLICFTALTLAGLGAIFYIAKVETPPPTPLITCTVITAEGKYEHMQLVEVSDGFVEVKNDKGMAVFFKNYIRIEQEK